MAKHRPARKEELEQVQVLSKNILSTLKGTNGTTGMLALQLAYISAAIAHGQHLDECISTLTHNWSGVEGIMSDIRKDMN